VKEMRIHLHQAIKKVQKEANDHLMSMAQIRSRYSDNPGAEETLKEEWLESVELMKVIMTDVDLFGANPNTFKATILYY
jgi:hypothetical protein